jgi:hypothetical protein
LLDVPGEYTDRIVTITGQYKTKGRGFLVGEVISIYIRLWTDNKQTYQYLKQIIGVTDNSVVIENAEVPSFYGKDISKSLEKRYQDIPTAVLLPRFDDYNNAITLTGDVIFTKEGNLDFGPPLKMMIIEDPNIKNPRGAEIAPAYVKYQIDASKRSEFFTNIALSLTLFGLFLANRKK